MKTNLRGLKDPQLSPLRRRREKTFLERLARFVSTTALMSAFVLPAHSQAFSSADTTIPGVVEPLELMGDPKPFIEPSEVQKRLADAFPKTDDPEDLKKAKESVDKIIQEYPQSEEARSARLMFLCKINSKDDPVHSTDIDTILQLRKVTAEEDGLLSEASLRAVQAKVEYDSGNLHKAVEELNIAIAVNIPSADEVLNSGSVAPVSKSDPCAWNKPDLDSLVREYPDDYRPLLFRGLYYAVFARFSESSQYAQQAIADFNLAGTLSPKSSLPQYFLGKVYMTNLGVMLGTDPDSTQKRAKALAAYDKSIQANPRFTPALLERAEIYYESKQYPEAIKDYDRAIAIDDGERGAYNDRGLAKMALNDFYGAISDFGSAINGKGKLSDLKGTYENRADAYVKVRDYDEAIKDFTEAIKLYLGDEIFLMNIAQVKKLYPEYVGVSDDLLCRKLHKMFFQNMKYEDFSKQLMEENPKRGDFDTFLIPDLLVKRGDAYLARGDYKRAIIDYQRETNGFAYGRKTAERWHLVSKTSSGLFLIDSQTAQYSNANEPRMWVKLTDTSSAGKGSYSEEQYAIDCQLKKIDTLSFLKYNARGEVTNTSSFESGWQTIVPDSLGEQLLRGMCY